MLIMVIDEPKIKKIDFNKVREFASEGYEDGEIADLLNISFQVYMQYYNKGKSTKLVKNYEYYRAFYCAVVSGRRDFIANSK